MYLSSDPTDTNRESNFWETLSLLIHLDGIHGMCFQYNEIFDNLTQAALHLSVAGCGETLK